LEKLRLNSVCLFILLSFAPVIYAQSDDINIHVICERSSSKCLEQIDQQLKSVPKQSRVWFQYKLYQFDALFQLAKIEQLKKEVAPWIDVKDIPLKFKINVYFYHAKSLVNDGKSELARQYLNKTIDLLTSVSQLYTDPMMTIQIANALNYLGENQQGYEMLKVLDKKFFTRNDPMFKLELYGNLGHFSQRLGHFEEHIELRLKAVDAANKLLNKHIYAVATYNVGRAYQMVDSYGNAFDYFNESRKWFLAEKDSYGAELALMRQAQLSMKQQDEDRAKKIFNQIDLDAIYQFHQAELDELANYIAN
jgi:tetratricopeptide (TPR) repeat protein